MAAPGWDDFVTTNYFTGIQKKWGEGRGPNTV